MDFELKHQLDHDVHRTIAYHENPKMICPVKNSEMTLGLGPAPFAKAVPLNGGRVHELDVNGASLKDDMLVHKDPNSNVNTGVLVAPISNWLASEQVPGRPSGWFAVDPVDIHSVAGDAPKFSARVAQRAATAHADLQNARAAVTTAVDKVAARKLLREKEDASHEANAVYMQVANAAPIAKAAFDDVVAAEALKELARLSLSGSADAAARAAAENDLAAAKSALTIAQVNEATAVMGLLHQSDRKSTRPRVKNAYMCLKLRPIDLTTTGAKDWRFVEDNVPSGHRTLLPIADAQPQSGPHGSKAAYKFDVLEELPWELHCMLIVAGAVPRSLRGGRDNESLAVAIVIDKVLEFLDYEDTVTSVRVLSKLHAADYTALSYFSDDPKFLEDAEHVIDIASMFCE